MDGNEKRISILFAFFGIRIPCPFKSEEASTSTPLFLMLDDFLDEGR